MKNQNPINIAVLIALSIILFKTCSLSTSKINKRLNVIESKINTIDSTMIDKKTLQIEGLKNEKRMIQSTDRKMIDVQRQTEIDKEIQILTK